MIGRVLSILIAALVFLMPVAAAETTTNTTMDAEATTSIVILVSDNPADLAVANDLKIMMSGKVNIHIVKINWGTYDDSIATTIASYNPALVIIIGGDAAVPEEYEGDLENFGIEYTRIGGNNQYETLMKAIDWATDNGFEYSGEVYVADGRAYVEIKELSDQGYFVIFDNGHMKVAKKIIDELNPQSVTVDEDIKSAVEDTHKNIKTLKKEEIVNKIIEKLQEKLKKVPPEKREKILKRIQMIEKMKTEGKGHFILIAEDNDEEDNNNPINVVAKINEVKAKNKVRHQWKNLLRMLAANNLLPKYKDEIIEINNLIKEGKYEEAYEKIQEIYDKAKDDMTFTIPAITHTKHKHINIPAIIDWNKKDNKEETTKHSKDSTTLSIGIGGGEHKKNTTTTKKHNITGSMDVSVSGNSTTLSIGIGMGLSSDDSEKTTTETTESMGTSSDNTKKDIKTTIETTGGDNE